MSSAGGSHTLQHARKDLAAEHERRDGAPEPLRRIPRIDPVHGLCKRQSADRHRRVAPSGRNALCKRASLESSHRRHHANSTQARPAHSAARMASMTPAPPPDHPHRTSGGPSEPCDNACVAVCLGLTPRWPRVHDLMLCTSDQLRVPRSKLSSTVQLLARAFRDR